MIEVQVDGMEGKLLYPVLINNISTTSFTTFWQAIINIMMNNQEEKRSLIIELCEHFKHYNTLANSKL